MVDHKKAALAFLARGGRFHDLAGDTNRYLRGLMIEWLTGDDKPALYKCSVSRVRDALIAASGVSVVECGIEANVEKAVKEWANTLCNGTGRG